MEGKPNYIKSKKFLIPLLWLLPYHPIRKTYSAANQKFDWIVDNGLKRLYGPIRGLKCQNESSHLYGVATWGLIFWVDYLGLDTFPDRLARIKMSSGVLFSQWEERLTTLSIFPPPWINSTRYRGKVYSCGIIQSPKQ